MTIVRKIKYETNQLNSVIKDVHMKSAIIGSVYDKWAYRLLFLAVVASNLSQLPVLVSMGATQYLNYPFWIILLIYCVIKKKITVKIRMVKIYGAFFIVLILALIHEIITQYSYLNSSIVTCLLISIMMYSIGEFTGKGLNNNSLKNISLAYAVSAVIVAIAIYIEYFSKGFDLSSRVYAYASKNSVSQIIFTSIVIMMFIKWESKSNRFIKNAIRVFFIIFQIILIALLRSRATILGFLICILYLLFTKRQNKELKKWISVIVVVGIVILLTNENARNVIIYNILLAGRNATNLDMITSGRISILASFPEWIHGNWITGIGATYFECFPLSAILQFGIISGVIIISIAYFPLMACFRWRIVNEYTEMFLMIAVGYIINSFFEGLAPIGPGVKCYYMWLMFGILESKYAMKKS